MSITEWVAQAQALLSSPWALLAMAAVVLADSYTVVLPGETFVTALGAIAASTGSPPLWLVIIVAAASAYVADVSLYYLGRAVGLDRWRWMRAARVVALLGWARRRLHQRSASVMFVARFLPYARIAVNLVAGASQVPARRFLSTVGLASLAWASYQALIGAVVSTVVPGGPLVAVAVSVVLALGLGYLVDRLLERFSPVDPPAPGAD